MNLKEKIFKKVNDRKFNPKTAGYTKFIYCEVNEEYVSLPKPVRSTYYLLSKKANVLDKIAEGEEILAAGISKSCIEDNLNDIFDNIQHIKESCEGHCRQCYLWLYYNNATDMYSLVFYPVLAPYRITKTI
jgi:hypothetical protein